MTENTKYNNHNNNNNMDKYKSTINFNDGFILEI